MSFLGLNSQFLLSVRLEADYAYVCVIYTDHMSSVVLFNNVFDKRESLARIVDNSKPKKGINVCQEHLIRHFLPQIDKKIPLGYSHLLHLQVVFQRSLLRLQHHLSKVARVSFFRTPIMPSIPSGKRIDNVVIPKTTILAIHAQYFFCSKSDLTL